MGGRSSAEIRLAPGWSRWACDSDRCCRAHFLEDERKWIQRQIEALRSRRIRRADSSAHGSSTRGKGQAEPGSQLE